MFLLSYYNLLDDLRLDMLIDTAYDVGTVHHELLAKGCVADLYVHDSASHRDIGSVA